MERNVAERFTGWSLIAAGAMFWLGWMLMPAHLGAYFQPGDFAAVREHFHVWIWAYRVHMFGMVAGAIALMAFGSQLTEHAGRVLAWPGIGVVTAGTFVGALAAAFYYHHGAWGALDLQDKPADAVAAFIAALKVDTEYVTCLTRFGRVFTGLGFTVLGVGLFKWAMLPKVLGLAAALLGVAGMMLTMLLPDQLQLYMPIFHLWPAWFAAAGVAVLRGGIPTRQG